MKIWTVNYMSYEMAKELNRGYPEDCSPYTVHSDRDGAVASVLKEINQYIVEQNDDIRGGTDEPEFPGIEFLPTMTADELRWTDCHVGGGTWQGKEIPTKKRWKYYNEMDEGTWIITELELDSDD